MPTMCCKRLQVHIKNATGGNRICKECSSHCDLYMCASLGNNVQSAITVEEPSGICRSAHRLCPQASWCSCPTRRLYNSSLTEPPGRQSYHRKKRKEKTLPLGIHLMLYLDCMAELGGLVPVMLRQQLVQNQGVGGHPGHYLGPITLPQHALTAREAADQGSLTQVPVEAGTRHNQ